MAQAAHAHTEHHGGGGGEHHTPHHSPAYYVKIWALLLGLLVISILGPMLGHKVLTIITAFGIAVVKALIVAAFFMHLNIEKKYVWYLLFSMLLMVALFFFAVAPDVMRYDGRNWTKPESVEYAKEFHKVANGHEGAHEAGMESGQTHEGAAAEAEKPKEH